MDRLILQLKALADENRFRIMNMLRIRPLCSCELLSILDIAGGTLSAHMKILKSAGLISQEKQGRWIEFRPSDSLTNNLMDYLDTHLKNTDVLERDKKALATVNRQGCNPK